MKNIFIIASFALGSSLSSCSKQTDDIVYIRFENTSDEPLNKAHIRSYYATISDYNEIHIPLGNLQPGELTGYIGFKSLCIVDGIPLVELAASVNERELIGTPVCGVGTRNMQNGRYTARIVLNEHNLFITMAR